MATIKRGNWSFKDPDDNIPNGSTIEGGNFSQKEPDTEILVGKTLTINGGNFVNVKPQPEWTITGGNWAKISYCYHLHPELNLPEEPENCRHVVDTTVIGDETFYEREDTYEGKSWPI